jgi:Pyridoxamine 5'-phosphate oxidase
MDVPWQGAGLRWSAFEGAAPELAARGLARIKEFGFVFVGTIRPDGAPRISPVEAHRVSGDLMLAVIGASEKARDLVRDPRVTLQSPISDAAEPGCEFKLRGYVDDADAVLRADTADTIERASGWRPSERWSYRCVLIQSAVLIDWMDDGDMLLSRWDQRHGVRETERRMLDIADSVYRRPS